MLPAGALSLQFDSVQINDTLNPDLSINESISIKLSGNTAGNITFTLPQGAKDIYTGARKSSVDNNAVLINLSCFSCSLDISYVLENAVSRQPDGQYVFSRTVNLPQPVSRYAYFVMLPQGGSLSSTQEPDPPIVPEATSIVTNGKNIIVSWEDSNPKLPQRYFIRFILQEQGNIGLSEELGEREVWGLLALAFLLGFIVALALLKIRKPRPPLPVVHKTLLSPDERKVVGLLRENNKTMHQRDIVAKTGWSKSKVSAVVTNLQYKEMISKEKLGRNYKVTLIKDFGGD